MVTYPTNVHVYSASVDLYSTVQYSRGFMIFFSNPPTYRQSHVGWQPFGFANKMIYS